MDHLTPEPPLRSRRRKETQTLQTEKDQSLVTSTATVQEFKARRLAWENSHPGPAMSDVKQARGVARVFVFLKASGRFAFSTGSECQNVFRAAAPAFSRCSACSPYAAPQGRSQLTHAVTARKRSAPHLSNGPWPTQGLGRARGRRRLFQREGGGVQFGGPRGQQAPENFQPIAEPGRQSRLQSLPALVCPPAFLFAIPPG